MKNNRTFLEKLLDGAEVEWKPLSLVTEMQRGKTITAKSANEGNIPVISGGQKPAYYHNESNRDGKTITVAGSGAYAGYIMYWEEPIFVSDAFSIKTDESLLQIKYVYHFLLQNQQKIYAMKKGSGVPHVYPKDIGTLMIPIPPLPVQTEIVKILDALTALTSELTSELTLRRKQYEYYREKLLSEEELIKLGATTENLGDITSITSGGTPSTKEPAYWVEGNIPWIKSESCKNKLIDEIKHHITEMGLQNSNAKLLSPNTTLMAMVGATIFKTAFLPFEATTNQNIAAIKSKNELSITDKFIFYYLTNMYDFFISKLSGYNMVNLSQIKNIKILLPPLEEQQRIVSILDKFEALTNSITEGLPLAIEQSQKRYEYYRELLLNFPGRE
jgi:hypothetical protein